MKALVTGATGFVGAGVVARLLEDNVCLRAAVRTISSALPPPVAQVPVGAITPETDWRVATAGVDVVIHLAARVHQTHDRAMNSRLEYRRVNSLATLQLARQAAESGAKRFVFLSSIKAATGADDRPSHDAYGESKREAEVALRGIAAEQGLEVVIIRSPLVYGPGVKANFRALMRAVERGFPLPLGAVRNSRSFVALDNLTDFISVCLTHPAAANETFGVSDGEDLSTAELIRRMAAAMNRPARLVAVPTAVLHLVAAVAGQSASAERLLGDLRVNLDRARELLDWHPPIKVDEGLRRAVARYD